MVILITACEMVQDSTDLHLDSHSNANLKDIDRELISAALFGDLQEARRLISQGANVNVDLCVGYDDCMQSSSTPLELAVVNGNLEMVKFLVENGADVNFGLGALKFALTEYGYDSKEITRFLIQNGADISSISVFDIIDVLDRVNTQMIDVLVANGVDIDKKNDEGKSILLYLASLRWFDAIEPIIENGANVNLKDNKGNTALALVSRYLYDNEKYEKTQIDVIKSLIKHGADINAKDEFGKSALDYLKQYLDNDEYRAIFGKNK
ncbi:ankyrin repeat domain-containing protein [Helicobacter sp. 23-1044]